MSYLTDNSQVSYVIHSDLSVTETFPSLGTVTGATNEFTRASYVATYITGSSITSSVSTGVYSPNFVSASTLAILEFGVLNGNWTKVQADAVLASAVSQGKTFFLSDGITPPPFTSVIAGTYGDIPVTSPSPQLITSLIQTTVETANASGITLASPQSTYALTSTVNATDIQKAYIAQWHYLKSLSWYFCCSLRSAALRI